MPLPKSLAGGTEVTPSLTFKLSKYESLTFELEEGVSTLGREPENTIVIENRYISSRHASFDWDSDSGKIYVTDLDSHNGIRVDGKRVTERAEIIDGVVLAFGQLEAEFFTTGAPTSKSLAPAPSLRRNESTDADKGSEVPTEPINIVPLSPPPPKPDGWGEVQRSDIKTETKTFRAEKSDAATVLVDEETPELRTAKEELQVTRKKIEELELQSRELSATIQAKATFEEQVIRLEAKKATLTEEVSDLEALDQRVKVAGEDLAKTKEEYGELTAQHEELSSVVSGLENKWEKLEKNLQERGSEFDSLNKEKKALAETVAETRQSCEGLEARQAELEPTVAELEVAKRRLDETSTKLGDTQSNLNKTETQFAERQRQLEKLVEGNDELKTQITYAQTTFADLDGRSKGLSAEVDRLSGKKETLLVETADLDRLKAEADAASQSKTQLTAELVVLGENRTQIEAIVADLTSRSEGLEETAVRHEKLQESVAGQQVRIVELTETRKNLEYTEEALEARTGELEEAERSLDHARSELEQLARQKAADEDNLSFLEAEISQLGTESTDLREKRKELRETEQQLSGNLQEVTALEVYKQELIGDLTGLESQLEAARIEIEARNNQVTGLESKVAGLDTQSAAYDELVRQHEALLLEVAPLEDARGELYQTRDRLGKLGQDEAQLSAECTQSRADVAAALERLAALHQEVIFMEAERQRLGQIRAETERLTLETQAWEPRLEEAKRGLAQTEKHNERLRKDGAELKKKTQKLKSIESGIAAGEKRLAKLEETERRLAVANAELKARKEEDRNLRSSVARLEGRKKELAKTDDLHRGTVQFISREIIKGIDLVDNMVGTYRHGRRQPEVAAQLTVLREGLLDLLQKSDVTQFDFDPGSEIGVAERKRIQIVDSADGAASKGGKAKVLETLRPGFLCPGATSGQPTVLRKAEVRLLQS